MFLTFEEGNNNRSPWIQDWASSGCVHRGAILGAFVCRKCTSGAGPFDKIGLNVPGQAGTTEHVQLRTELVFVSLIHLCSISSAEISSLFIDISTN